MTSIFRGSHASATLVQLGAELSWLFVAVLIAVWFHESAMPLGSAIAVPAAAFSLLMVFLNGAFGLYRNDQNRLDFSGYVSRLSLAMLIGALVAYLAASLVPGGGEFRSTLPEVTLLAFCGLILLRQVILSPLTKMLLPRRVLVLGTGSEARLVESSLGPTDPSGVHLVGFYSLSRARTSPRT